MFAVFSWPLKLRIVLSIGVLVSVAFGGLKPANSADTPLTRDDYERNQALLLDG